MEDVTEDSQEETQAVETETTDDPQVEEQTTQETESTEATTDDENHEELPVEGGRASKRIQQLIKEKKEAEEKAAYWENLNKKAEELPTESDGEVTVDQIANAVINKQNAIQTQKQQEEATKQLEADAETAIKKYPILDTDQDVADAVIMMARAKRISITAAADKYMALVKKEQEIAEKKVLADQSQKVGVSSPRGGVISSGEAKKPDISKMDKEELRANWEDILSSYNE